MQIPKICKYIHTTEMDELYEHCLKLNLPEAQWQLKLVELVQKRLHR